MELTLFCSYNSDKNGVKNYVCLAVITTTSPYLNNSAPLHGFRSLCTCTCFSNSNPNSL